ncbi:MAG: hypothetical protein HRT58_06400 [Crocinitomicaceae bacterium]|nr:hypothetical protein [Flavobacteriales bacterium]NQZ35275.1 hypothetical protein [Crocinitomicaceae bacterium]
MNKSFNPKIGIICGITNEPADFKGNCVDYKEDTKELEHAEWKEQDLKKDVNKAVNRGRIALFVLGAFYILVGAYESFLIPNANLIFGFIDCSLGAIFILLGIWSYTKASPALITGLIFYCLIILLLFLLDPMTLIGGIIWKVIIIAWLVYAISIARADEAKQKKLSSNDDLLDQL